MKIKRALLKQELSVIAPAVADKAKIAGLDCIWFDGKTVSAYNDLIGIEKTLETDFIGGVPGKLLLGYLDNITTDEVELTLKGTGKDDPITGLEYQDLIVSAGKSKLKLSLRPIAARLWTFPEYDQSNQVVLTKDFLNVLDMSLVSIPKTAVNDEFLGVTFELSDDRLNLYTTDQVTLCWSTLPIPDNYKCNRVTITGEFCEQLLKICGVEDNLFVSLNAAIAINKVGTRIFGRILEIESPNDFQQQIRNNISEDEQYIQIPTELSNALDRAELITYGQNDSVQLTMSGDSLNLYLKSDLGELNDSLEIEYQDNRVQGYFEPGLIKRGLSERAFFTIKETCMTLIGPDNFVHLIAPRYT